MVREKFAEKSCEHSRLILNEIISSFGYHYGIRDSMNINAFMLSF